MKHNFLSILDLSKGEQLEIFNLADMGKDIFKNYSHSLDGMVLASLFFQPSTRTQFSFQSAFLKLGGSIIECADINETRSGAPYYEPIGDMAKIISNYSDIVVMRTENNLQTVEMDANIEVPFISAGSGNIEHPTQALTDLYTVRQYFGALESHDILIIGTPRQRTINSFIKGMSLWAKQNYHILCQEGVCINQDVKKSLGKSNVTYYSSWDDIYESGIYKNISIIYMDKFFYETNRHSIYVPDEKMFKTHFSKEAIILHPLPRTQELPCFFDDLNNAKYFVQAKNGLYIRSGLFLHYLL